ncbi:hypothetical protein F2Q68_00013384 [Brassica cretica]|uniref:AAA+ ATPase domain-containing protein n=1 Tax=Brassica cretica TaxID=69181 RepID=A0A8S9HRA4_BRACR|nr:hypothetical protein F2Q68_00013384 [Brassica cretica]
MSGLKISDPSKLHLKKELTQIRKVSKCLRDPETSSSWKSPLTSSRSVPVKEELPPSNDNVELLNQLDSQFRVESSRGKEKEKKVFLYNWKSHKTSSDDNDDDVSDARNGGDSTMFRCRDKNRFTKKKRRFLSRYPHHHQPKEATSGEETEDFSNSESLGKLTQMLKLKHKNWSRSSSYKFLRATSKRDSSSYTCNSTPALSTSSYNNLYAIRSPSTVESFDDDNNLDVTGRQQGCGIPFYRTHKRNLKHRGGCRSCCSPSFSDTLRRKGSTILCGGSRQYMHRHSSGRCNKKLSVVPLLKYRGDSTRGGRSSLGSDDDFGELDLESQSRLDGRRWSTSCKSHGEEEGSSPENTQSLSIKYKPMFFDELVGQSTVVNSLMNALKKGRVAGVYLFQGPRGTGKTSTARIFSAALNCDVLANEEMKPHLLPSKTWLLLLKFLEKPLQRVVFICVTTELGNVPRTIQSRCQKLLFNKLKDGDIVVRLRKIASDENLDVESQALSLIALNADGSLRDAETMLDQLSLMGKRITVDLVNELVGVVSDENLLELLELALASDTAETVKKARELLDLGADPILMMSQLASLIMDIIAGAYKALDEKYSDAFLDGRNLSEPEMERLKHALKILSETEKQLRVTTDRSTWFIATLLQLGLMPSPGSTHSSSSRRQSSIATEEHPSSISREVIAYKQRSSLQRNNSASPTSIRKGETTVHEVTSFSSSSEVLENDASISEKLNDIWMKCVDRCHSKTLKQLLYSHGKLLSISEVKGTLVAYIAFGDREIKLRAEGFVRSITNSIETVLRRNVEVRMILLCETELLSSKQTRQTAVADSSDTESGHEVPMKRIETIIQEQRLETERLQKTPGSQGLLKPERNQVSPQEDTSYHHHQPNIGSAVSSGLNNEVLKICKMDEVQENQTCKRMEHCPVSPSILHDSNFTNNKDDLGYESVSGRGVCSLLFCWKTQKSPRITKIKGTSVRSRRSRKRRFLLFSGCAKTRK